MGINAKLILASMTSSAVSTTEPKEAGILDLGGFDTTAPMRLNDFATPPPPAGA